MDKTVCFLFFECENDCYILYITLLLVASGLMFVTSESNVKSMIVFDEGKGDLRMGVCDADINQDDEHRR